MIPVAADTDDIALAGAIGGPPPTPPEPEGLGIMSALRRQNMPLNVAMALGDIHDEWIDPAYDPWADPQVAGTPYEDRGDLFTYSASPAHTARIIAKDRRQEADTLDRASRGFGGLLVDFAAGMADPTVFIPYTVVARGLRGGVSVGGSVRRGAMAGAAQGALYEAGMRMYQERTAEQALTNVGTASVLTAIIGGGASALMSRGERKASEKLLEQARVEMTMPEPRSAGAAAVGAGDASRAPLLPPRVGQAMRAAAERIGELPVVGPGLKFVATLPSRMITKADPVNRVLGGSFKEAQNMVADMADIGGYLARNYDHMATTPYGVSIEREVKDALRIAEFRALTAVDRAYREVVYGDAKARFPKLRTTVANRFGMSAGGARPRMTMGEFLDELDYALRNDDTHPTIHQIGDLARNVFRPIVEEWKQRAVAAGKMDIGDGPPLGARSYWPRVFDRVKTVANANDFKDMVKRSKRADNIVKSGIQRALAGLATSLDRYKDQARKLTGRLDTASRELEERETRLAERGMETAAAVGRGFTMSQRRAEADAAVKTMREFIADLRAVDNTPDIRRQIAELEKEADELEAGFAEISEKDLDKLEQAERAGDRARRRQFLAGPTRRVGRILIDKEREPKLTGTSSPETEWIVASVREIEDLQADGIAPRFSTLDEFADFMTGYHAEMTAADYDRIVGELAAGTGAMERRLAAMDIAASADIRRDTVALVADSMARARDTKARLDLAAGKARARSGEAKVAETRNLTRIGILNRQAAVLQNKRDWLAAMLTRTEDNIAQTRLHMEDRLGVWSGKTVNQVKAAIAKRAEQETARLAKIAAGTYKGQNRRLTGADKVVDDAVKDIVERDLAMTDAELGEFADDVYNSATGVPDGRLPSDDPIYDAVFGESLRGPFMRRDMPTPDNDLRPYLVTNPIAALMRYVRTVASDTMMAERFGGVDAPDIRIRLNEEKNAKLATATTRRERQAIDDEFAAHERDLHDMRDIVRGTFGHASGETLRNAGRIAQTLSNWETMTSGGGFGLAAIPDLMAHVARWGFDRSFRASLGAAMRSLLRIDDVFKDAAAGYRREIAVITDTLIRSRASALNDIDQIYESGTIAGRIAKTGAEWTAVLSGLTLMTDFTQALVAVSTGSRIVRMSRDLIAGSLRSDDAARLAALNIDIDKARRIVAAYDGPDGGWTDGDVHFPNLQNWADADIARRFRFAVSSEVDKSVVSPGLDVPVIMHKPLIGLLLKYKRIIAGLNSRLLIPSMQMRDANALSGVFGMILLGMLSYAIRAPLANQTLSDDWRHWVKEGVDRSGVLGWLQESNAMMSQVSHNSVDLWRLVGAGRPYSRYSGRSPLASAAGPMAAKAESVLQVLGAAGARDMTAADVRRLRQLIPFQNLFYIRRLIDEIEAGAANAIGIRSRKAA